MQKGRRNASFFGDRMVKILLFYFAVRTDYFVISDIINPFQIIFVEISADFYVAPSRLYSAPNKSMAANFYSFFNLLYVKNPGLKLFFLSLGKSAAVNLLSKVRYKTIFSLSFSSNSLSLSQGILPALIARIAPV